MKRGVNAWIFPRDFSLDQIFEASASIGYEGVELNLDEEKLDPWKAPKAERKEIVEKAESLGIDLPSLCTGLFWKYNLAGTDEALRRRGIELMAKGCEFASDLGAKVLLVVPAIATPEVSYKSMWNRSKEAILQGASKAEEFGIYLGIENVWNRFLYSPLEFRAFLEELNHDYVKAYFDVGNALFLGFPQHWIEILSDYITCIHVKDFNMKLRQFKPLLQGDVPWKAVIEALRKINYGFFLNVELGPLPEDPLKSASESKAALDKILSLEA
ncbi:MAG: sugar phosphate isomerase/epimerase family protein [Candidatus Bathyarchaeia archaeon]